MTTFTGKIIKKILRVLIIDDESPVRATLRGLLDKTCPRVQIPSNILFVRDFLIVLHTISILKSLHLHMYIPLRSV